MREPVPARRISAEVRATAARARRRAAEAPDAVEIVSWWAAALADPYRDGSDAELDAAAAEALACRAEVDHLLKVMAGILGEN